MPGGFDSLSPWGQSGFSSRWLWQPTTGGVNILSPRGIILDDHFKAGFNAGYAVLFFYVISGFLITYTLTRNYTPDLSGTGDFYRRRFIRIFSLYWPIVLLAFLLMPDAWANFVAKGFWDQIHLNLSHWHGLASSVRLVS